MTKFAWLESEELTNLAKLSAPVAVVAFWMVAKRRYQIIKAKVFAERYLRYLEAEYRGNEFRRRLKELRACESQDDTLGSSEFVATAQAVFSYNKNASRFWDELKVEIASTRFLMREQILELMHRELSSKMLNSFTNEVYENLPSGYSHFDHLRRDLELLIMHDGAFHEPKMFHESLKKNQF